MSGEGGGAYLGLCVECLVMATVRAVSTVFLRELLTAGLQIFVRRDAFSENLLKPGQPATNGCLMGR